MVTGKAGRRPRSPAGCGRPATRGLSAGSMAVTPRHRPPATIRSRANQPSQIGRRSAGRRRRGSAPPPPPWRRRPRERPGPSMSSFARQLPHPPVVAVEHGAQSSQFPHPGRSLADQHLHGGGVTEAGPRRQGVGGVQGLRVARVLHVSLAVVEHRGHAPLGPLGRRVRERPLGEHPDRMPGSSSAARAAADRPATPLPTTRRSSWTGSLTGVPQGRIRRHRPAGKRSNAPGRLGGRGLLATASLLRITSGRSVLAAHQAPVGAGSAAVAGTLSIRRTRPRRAAMRSRTSPRTTFGQVRSSGSTTSA